MLNNILYLNKKIFLFNKITSHLCSFCRIDEEYVAHFFSECPCVKQLWCKLKTLFITDFSENNTTVCHFRFLEGNISCLFCSF